MSIGIDSSLTFFNEWNTLMFKLEEEKRKIKASLENRKSILNILIFSKLIKKTYINIVNF